VGLKEYDVEINGHKTTLQLSDKDATELGLTVPAGPAEAKAPAKAPANKARTPRNKQA
jgi:hypothetical protein